MSRTLIAARLGAFIVVSAICFLALLGCQSREELLVIPLEDGAPRWLVVEAEAMQLARDVEREAVWLVGQAAARASCLAGAAMAMEEEDESESNRSSTAKVRVATSMTSSAVTTRRISRVIDPNTASIRQLESLPRVGPATARAIVDGRPYARIEDLTRVRGIGPATFERLRPFLLIPGADGHSDPAVDP